MLDIVDGVVRNSRVKVELIPNISHGPLGPIHAIVVHQTDSNTGAGTLAGYRTGPRADGAHFLIDKDGTLYQTVPINKKCWHVGKIKSKCWETHTCTPTDQKRYEDYNKKGWSAFFLGSYRDEIRKSYPARYPTNEDSIGIEIVSKASDEHHFNPITAQEQATLDWLIPRLLATLKLTRTDIYRHALVSRKNEEEGKSAKFEGDSPIDDHDGDLPKRGATAAASS